MLTAALLFLLLALRQEGPDRNQPRDPHDPVRYAQQLIWDYYWDDGRSIYGSLLVSMGAPPRPISAYWHFEPCESDSWEVCFGGEWESVGLNDFRHEDQRTRRRLLIAELDRLASAPGDSPFLFRQRVAFALKNGEPERAKSVAHECSHDQWWCLGLRGLTAHWIKPGAGAPAFDSALALAPPALSCFWRQIAGVASPAVVAAVGAACGADAPELARFWWMADPLWSRAGNERQVEHFARHEMKVMVEELYSYPECGVTGYLARGLPNSIRRELVSLPADAEERYKHRAKIRCGVPGEIPGPVRASDARVQYVDIEYTYGGYSFAPDSLRFLAPLESRAQDWAVEWNVGEERMLTRERWYNLEDQVAIFRRGPDLLAVAAARLPPPLDTVAQLEPYLSLGRVEDLQLLTASARFDKDRVFRASMRVPDGGYLASLEVVGEDLIGRARHGVPAPPLVEGLGLSDLALVDVRFEEEEMELEAALLPSLALERGASVGLYFEVYGVRREERLAFALTAEPTERPSSFRRLLAAFGMGSEAQSVEVTWQEEIEEAAEPAVTRLLSLDTGGLSPGETRLTLTVTTGDGRTHSVGRRIRIRE
jgi:hypothetical protein